MIGSTLSSPFSSSFASAAPNLSLPLRLLPLGVSGVAHAALIAALMAASPLPSLPLALGDSVIEVSVIDAPEAGGVVPSEAADEAVPAEPIPPAPSPVAEPAPPITPAAPEVIEAAPPPVIVPPVITKALPKPAMVARAAPQKERKSTLPAARPSRPHGASDSMSAGQGAARGGGGTPGNAASGAAYAGRVRAILQGRANALGLEDQEGSVGVSFVIGASGRMESHAITRSSGSGTVDRQIRAMLASASFPAPPGGRFAGSVTIRIQ